MYNTNKIINQIKKNYPFHSSMCRDKYNETIQDLLYDIIICEL